jgi:hypothetical protein
MAWQGSGQMENVLCCWPLLFFSQLQMMHACELGFGTANLTFEKS